MQTLLFSIASNAALVLLCVFVFFLETGGIVHLLVVVRKLYSRIDVFVRNEERLLSENEQLRAANRQHVEKINGLSSSLGVTQNLLKEEHAERVALLDTNDHMLVTLDSFKTEAKTLTSKLNATTKRLHQLERANESLRGTLMQIQTGMHVIEETSSKPLHQPQQINPSRLQHQPSSNFFNAAHAGDKLLFEDSVRAELQSCISDNMFEAPSQSLGYHLSNLKQMQGSSDDNSGNGNGGGQKHTGSHNDASDIDHHSGGANQTTLHIANDTVDAAKHRDVRMKYYRALVKSEI